MQPDVPRSARATMADLSTIDHEDVLTEAEKRTGWISGSHSATAYLLPQQPAVGLRPTDSACTEVGSAKPQTVDSPLSWCLWPPQHRNGTTPCFAGGTRAIDFEAPTSPHHPTHH